MDGRLLDVDGTPQVVLSIGVSSDWRITGTVAELEALGLPLGGYFVVWAQPRADGRRLVGQLVSYSGGRARLLARDAAEIEVASSELSLEPSRTALTRLLGAAVGDAGASRLVNALAGRVGDFLKSPALLAEVRRVGTVLATHNPIALSDRLRPAPWRVAGARPRSSASAGRRYRR